jgi:hypothetical protein
MDLTCRAIPAMNLSLAQRKSPKTRKGEYSILYLIRVDKNFGFIPEFATNHKFFLELASKIGFFF